VRAEQQRVVAIVDYAPYEFIRRGFDAASEFFEGDVDCHYIFNADFPGPGRASDRQADLRGATITPLSIGADVAKGTFAKRCAQDMRWAFSLLRHLRQIGADTVLVSNTALPVLAVLAAYSAFARKLRWGVWVQDIYSSAFETVLVDKFPERIAAAGTTIADRVEGAALRRADMIFSIGETLDKEIQRLASRSAEPLPNWAMLDDFEPDNDAAATFGTDPERRIATYAGTLGVKHDLTDFVSLAQTLAASSWSLVVASEGDAADRLSDLLSDFEHAKVIPFQSDAAYRALLAESDLLLVALTDDAAQYSIPSKVLTYLCAGRPIAASIAPDNDAARIIKTIGCGTVASSLDAAAKTCMDLTDGERHELGDRGRAYAERHFAEPVIGRRLADALAELDPRLATIPTT